MLHTLLALCTLAIAGLLIFSWKILNRLEEAQTKLEGLTTQQTTQTIVQLLNWALDCLQHSFPKPIPDNEVFSQYNRAYEKFQGETDHLALSVLEFTKTWLVKPTLFQEGEGTLEECKEAALLLLDDISETLAFHDGIQEKFLLAALSIQPDFKPPTIHHTVRRCLKTAKAQIQAA